MEVVYVDEATFLKERRALKDDSIAALLKFYDAYAKSGRKYALAVKDESEQ